MHIINSDVITVSVILYERYGADYQNDEEMAEIFKINCNSLKTQMMWNLYSCVKQKISVKFWIIF